MIFLLVLVGLVFLLVLRGRITSLEEQLGEEQERRRELERSVDRLDAQLTDLTSTALAEPKATPAVTPPVPAPQPPPVAVTPPAPETPPVPVKTPISATAPPTEPDAQPAPPVPKAPAPAPAPVAKPAPPPVSRPSPPAPKPSPPPPPPYAVPALDWESFVGVKLFSAVAGIALVIAAVFFLRYSIEQGWLQPPVRVSIGILVGIGLLVTCELKAARRYPITANALDAAAVTVLFATFFSAHALWDLIPMVPTFALLVLVTATAVGLSIRRNSLLIAVLGLLGSFAVPALLTSAENRPVTLFGYLLLLNVGLAWVAYRKRWPLLTALTLAFTTLYQLDWVVRFLTASQLPLALGVFLLFPIVSFLALVFGPGQRAKRTTGEGSDPFEQTALLAAGVPLLFAAYLAAVPAYGARPGLLFSYLLIVDLGLFVVAVFRRTELLHAAGAVTTLLVFAVWLAVSYESSAWPLVLVPLAVAVALYLGAPVLAERWGRPFEDVAQSSVYAGPLLLFVLPVLAGIEPAVASPALLFGVLFALAGAITWQALTRGPSHLYFIAAFFAVAAEAVWSAVQLSAERLGTAVALYGLLGVSYLAVPVLARRWARPLEPKAGGGVVLIASLGLLLFLTTRPVAPEALFGLALLLAILNAGLFVESAATGLAALSIVGSLLSWLVMAAWWTQGATSVGVLPSLLVVAGLALIMLGGHARMRKNLPPPSAVGEGSPLLFGVARDIQSGLYLAFLGHFFLLFVSGVDTLSVPPWPLFGVLTLLTLAIGALSLYTHNAAPHVLAVLAAGLILVTWSATAAGAPWPVVGLVAAELVVVYAAGWLYMARRATPAWLEALAFATALAMAEFVAMIAAAQPGQPSIMLLIPVHVLNLTAALALARVYRVPAASYAALVLGWLAVLSWLSSHPEAGSWGSLLALATAVYLLFIALPFALGGRATSTRHPYITAALSGAAYLLVARHALDLGNLGWMVGAVPVAQAAVMALLLRQLLRAEPVGSRDMARLAIVAGSSLALITVAIPLQLNEQWVTIGWALEGAALAWLFGRIPHRGLLYSTVGLLGVVFIRLVNPSVFLLAPRGDLRVANWYLYTYGVCAAAFFLAGWWLSKTDDALAEGVPRPAHLAPAAGAVILFLLLNIEIADFYATGPALVFGFGLTLAQDLTYTIGWLVFGLLLLAVGIYERSHAARIAAIGLITVTTVKGFLYDLASLGGLYRVGSFVGLAVSLSLVALALQKWVFSQRREQT